MFLYRLHRAAMQEYVVQTWGQWDEAWQSHHFQQHFDRAACQIIVLHGQDIGVISVVRQVTDIFLSNIELLPTYQGQGIGTQLIKALVDEAHRKEVQLYAQLTNEFRPFSETENVTRTVSVPKRDEAFHEIVLQEYDFACAVCEMKFRLRELVEATAAHIVPKRKSGTDDPRNGLALCRTHHWAFDAGLFSVNSNYGVILSPAVRQAETRNFGLLDLEGKLILLPQNEIMRPHTKSLEWHRTHVWQK